MKASPKSIGMNTYGILKDILTFETQNNTDFMTPTHLENAQFIQSNRIKISQQP